MSLINYLGCYSFINDAFESVIHSDLSGLFTFIFRQINPDVNYYFLSELYSFKAGSSKACLLFYPSKNGNYKFKKVKA